MSHEIVFHESFDSVRARSLDPYVNPQLAQVQTETLLTLLLGRSITMNNGQAFDSRSVLSLLNMVFESAAAVASRTSGRTELDLYRFHYPVIMRRHNAPTLLQGCIDQLTRLDPDNRFILSAWQRIDQDDDARMELADIMGRMEAGAWLDSIALPEFIRTDSLAHQQLYTLERLHHYLVQLPDVNLTTQKTPWALADRIRLIQDKGTAWLIDMAGKANCSETHAEEIYRAIRNRDAKLVNRTWVYGGDFEVEVGADAAPLVRELVDTLYNAQLANSAAATDAYLTTPPRSRNVVADAQVNELALAVAAVQTDAAVTERKLDEAAPMSGIFERLGTERNLNVEPLSLIFQAYWELIADADQRRTWQESCDNVNRLLGKRLDGQGARFEFAEAWDNHLALLRGCFGDVLHVEGDRLQILGSLDGEAFAQSNEPGRLRWASVEQAAAAGEYLDILSRAVR
jgi:hypothetical protein